MIQSTTKVTEASITALNNTSLISQNPPKKRRGRLKKGEKVLMSGYKTMTMEEAYKSVEGMKYKIANKYKVFCNSSVSYDDLIGAANIGLAWAYRDWDANTAKFTTFSHNRIERQIDLYLCEMLPKYKNNVDAKNWLRRKNDESYKQLIERGVTKDETFNELHKLDGEKDFTKEHYNLYTQKTANILYNDGQHLIITTASGFQNGDNQDFDIFNSLNNDDDNVESVLEEEFDSDDLEGDQKKIVELIMDGFSIAEIAKQFGMSKAKLVKLAGVKDF